MALEHRSQPLPRPLLRVFLLGMCLWVIGNITKLVVLGLPQFGLRLWQIVAVALMGGGSLLIGAGLAALVVASMRVRWRRGAGTRASWLWLVLLSAAYLCFAVAWVMSSLTFMLVPALVGWITSTFYISLGVGGALLVAANIPLMRFLWRLSRAAR